MGSIPTPGTKYMTKQVTTIPVTKVNTKRAAYYCIKGRWYELDKWDHRLYLVEEEDVNKKLTQLAADAAKQLTPYL